MIYGVTVLNIAGRQRLRSVHRYQLLSHSAYLTVSLDSYVSVFVLHMCYITVTRCGGPGGIED